MPNVKVDRDDLIKRAGFPDSEMTRAQFRNFCFTVGLELDDVVPDDGGDATVDHGRVYKIDVPNRCDMLCLEGLAQAFKAYLSSGQEPPSIPLMLPIPPSGYTMEVSPAVAGVRPIVLCAVLRNITFTADSYKRFIDLQDKLHDNICRHRTLVAIGTHDLDAIVRGPADAPNTTGAMAFTYEAHHPSQITFQALKQSAAMNALALCEKYETDHDYKHLGKFVPIIKKHPDAPDTDLYPVIKCNGHVLSLPPIINSEFTKISEETKNVFIECTATNQQRANTVMAVMLSCFVEYCAPGGGIQSVVVKYPGQAPVVTPVVEKKELAVSLAYARSLSGISDLTSAQMVSLAHRMMLPATAEGDLVRITIPPARGDMLHACDVVEDIAIAFGFDNIPRRDFPELSASEQPKQLIANLLKQELTAAGYSEWLSPALCARAWCCEDVCRPDCGNLATVANPKSVESQVVRNSLLPGLLKALFGAQTHKLPIKLFEVSDVVLVERSADGKLLPRNNTRLCAVYCNTDEKMEKIHELTDNLLIEMGLEPEDYEYSPDTDSYTISDNAFLENRRAEIVLHGKGQPETRVGILGAINFQVLDNFRISHLASAVEIDVEAIRKFIVATRSAAH